jgi:ABC-2 type transport system permease protein
MLSVLEVMFLSNCAAFAELVRTGNLDFYLLKPIDEQFLVTCHEIEWSVVPSFFMGCAVMAYALAQMGWAFDFVQVAAFVVVFVCGIAITYSFLLLLTATSVWMVRNQSLHEIWWLFTSLMRYPREIFTGWTYPLGLVFTFLIPIMLAINVPASTMAKGLEWPFVGLTVAAAVVLLAISRRVFRLSLRRYRSASS